jgi:SSS family solute:Na+ symporter
MIDTADWIIIAASLLICLGIGWWGAQKTAINAEGYFLAGRDMPWWILVTTTANSAALFRFFKDRA